jgi:uncharacterized protein YbjT (DUF2867 family)
MKVLILGATGKTGSLVTSRAQAPWWYKFLLMPTFLRGSARDKTNMEQAVAVKRRPSSRQNGYGRQ